MPMTCMTSEAAKQIFKTYTKRPVRVRPERCEEVLDELGRSGLSGMRFSLLVTNLRFLMPCERSGLPYRPASEGKPNSRGPHP